MNSIVYESTFANRDIQLQVVNTVELAKFILGLLPNMIVTVATHLEENLNKPFPWHGIVCTKIFEVQSILINNWSLDGGAPYMFDLSCFDANIDVVAEEEQSEECLQQMIEGLKRFRKLYGLEGDTWYLNTNDFEYLETSHIS